MKNKTLIIGMTLAILALLSATASAQWYTSGVTTDGQSYDVGETVVVTYHIYAGGASDIDHVRILAQYDHGTRYAYDGEIRLNYMGESKWGRTFTFTPHYSGTIEITAVAFNYEGNACGEATWTISVTDGASPEPLDEDSGYPVNQEPNNYGGGTPGFELLFAVIAIGVTICLRQYRNKKEGK